MAASLQGLVPLRRPDPDIYGIRPGADSFPVVVAPRFLGPAHSPLSKRRLGARLVPVDRRSMKFVPLAASGEEQAVTAPISKNAAGVDADLQSIEMIEKNLALSYKKKTARRLTETRVYRNRSDIELEKGAGASQEAWKKALQRFRTEALKVMAISEGAYGIYSKKAMEILMDTFEKLKIQADKARHDLRIIAKEFSKEGKEYFSTAAKNSPDSLRDILEIYASANDLKNVSAIRDFYLGILYGSFLAVGGFIYFMLTGSIPAIRFGVILGTAILALSVSSLRSWKNGKPTSLLLIGQTGFYAYRFVIDHREGPKRGTEFRELVIGEGDHES
ncbi:non-green plastid inner envelope membrane protein [Musa troglodytarum]|uniref:Non-green plastid inner envelope membrane protein n=1 Tax=Musa troglodytarum TaxID=320322 RepID=A0A9E7GS56_9LILI|nr:non-green plastid inner envelope membrane protein [Musa troglodytarum]